MFLPHELLISCLIKSAGQYHPVSIKSRFTLSQEETETPAIDFNQRSRDSSKEDDIQAICEQRGFGRNPPLALQLKAIDQEYHYLLESQQSDRCEYVQKLYAWKSKQATQVCFKLELHKQQNCCNLQQNLISTHVK